MMEEIDKFFKKDEDAFYINESGKKCFRGVRFPEDTIRKDKAKQQAKLPVVPYNEIFTYVNEFLELIRLNGGFQEKNVMQKSIKLDGIEQEILSNGLIAKNCNWVLPIFDKKKWKYTFYDKKYEVIKEEFNLLDAKDIVWLKFTKTGKLCVVAKSFDINFNKDNSCGILVDEVEEELDESFVFIFPLTSEIKKNYENGQIELGIGNYLISKNVPIIDYYSHNN